MQLWNVLHAARWKTTGRKNDATILHLRTIAQLYLSGYVFATKAHIDNRKKMLNGNTSPTCPYNMVNFGPLAVEIGSGAWGTG